MKTLLICALLWSPLQAANPAVSQAAPPKVLWHAPPDWTPKDWACGTGGCGLAPAPPFRFVREEMTGTDPKITVQDSRGRTWSVKFGAEVIPECFASRFVAALGYFGEITYFVRSGTVEGVRKLRRARYVVQADGHFTNGRFELRGQPGPVFLDGQAWAWNDNPFLGSHPLAGLKIAMMLLSNWDAKDARDGVESNNGVFRTMRDGKPELFYAVFDWGASLGQWGGVLRRQKCDCPEFTRDTPRFIEGAGGGQIQWGYVGKHGASLKGGITIGDVRWLLPYLQRITPQDLDAGLKASGASERQAACWSWAIGNRIQQLAAIAR
jgi:hypothetical protein